MSSVPDSTQVLIIRHGEKPVDPKKDNGKASLQDLPQKLLFGDSAS